MNYRTKTISPIFDTYLYRILAILFLQILNNDLCLGSDKIEKNQSKSPITSQMSPNNPTESKNNKLKSPQGVESKAQNPFPVQPPYPESVIQASIRELKTLSQQIESSNLLYNKTFSSKNLSANEALNRSRKSYQHQDYQSVIRNLNAFLNNSQTPHPTDYLQAQYLLGKSYQMLNRPEKAIRAYRRYISSFITTKEKKYSDLMDIIRFSLPLYHKSSSTFRSFLSGLIGIDLPNQIKEEITYYYSRAAISNLPLYLGNTLFSQWIYHTDDSPLKAKFLLAQAMILIKNNHLNQAIYLLNIIEDIAKDRPQLIDFTRLTLARIHVILKKPNNAISYYNLIQSSSHYWLQSTFERIYILANLERFDQALTEAKIFTEKSKNPSEKFQISRLVIYLLLKTNKLEEASKKIAQSEANLKKVRKYLSTLSFHQKVSYSDIIKIKSINPSLSPPHWIIKDADFLFQNILSINIKLDKLRSRIRNFLHHQGRLSLRSSYPLLAIQGKQIERLILELLNIGNRIINSEKIIFDKQLSDKEKLELTRSKQRRSKIINSTLDPINEYKEWRRYSQLSTLQAYLTNSYKKIRNTQAKLSYLIHATPSHTRKKIFDGRAIREKASKIEADLSKSTERLRKKQAMIIIKNNSLIPLKKQFVSYVSAIQDENSILQNYRTKRLDLSSENIYESLKTAWSQWDLLANKIFLRLNHLQIEISKHIHQRINKIDQLLEIYQSLSEKSHDLNRKLESSLKYYLPVLMSHYQSATHSHSSTNQNWLTNIDWIKIEEKTKKQNSLIKKFHLEKTILEENLKDLNIGVLWKWPETGFSL